MKIALKTEANKASILTLGQLNLYFGFSKCIAVSTPKREFCLYSDDPTTCFFICKLGCEEFEELEASEFEIAMHKTILDHFTEQYVGERLLPEEIDDFK